MVTVFVPVAVPLGTVTVKVDVPEAVIDEGLKLVVNPFVAVAVSETVPEYPPRALMVIVEVPVVPAFTVIGLGDAKIEKSGVVTAVKSVVLGLPIPVAKS